MENVEYIEMTMELVNAQGKEYLETMSAWNAFQALIKRNHMMIPEYDKVIDHLALVIHINLLKYVMNTYLTIPELRSHKDIIEHPEWYHMITDGLI